MKLVGLTEIYEQEQDCCGPTDDTGQDITISVEDGGGGPYLVLSTKRWAISDRKEVLRFAAKLRSLLARFEA